MQVPDKNPFKFTLEDAKEAFPMAYLEWWESTEREKYRLEHDDVYWLETHIEQMLVHTLSTSDAVKIFANKKKAKSILKKWMADKRKELSWLDEEERDQKNRVAKLPLNRHDKEQANWFNGAIIEGRREEIRLRLKKCDTMLMFLSPDKNNVMANGAKDIIKAKDIPMDYLIDFNSSGSALCIWHDEKTPSMHWNRKTNRVKCFGCDMGGDTIDVVIQLQGVDFKEALGVLLSSYAQNPKQ